MTTYTISFRVPATETEKVAPVFSHDIESPVTGKDNKVTRPAREAGKTLSVQSKSEAVAKTLAEILAKDFEEVVITQS